MGVVEAVGAEVRTLRPGPAGDCAMGLLGRDVRVLPRGAVQTSSLAARRLGAERVIVLGRHPDRLAIARRFGATNCVEERGDAALGRARGLTGGGAPRDRVRRPRGAG
jgi:hypothetical protein